MYILPKIFKSNCQSMCEMPILIEETVRKRLNKHYICSYFNLYLNTL